MLLVRNIRLPLPCPDPDAEAAAKALAILRVPARRAAHCGVAKLSVDARHGTPVLVYTIAVTLKDEGEESAFAGASPCVALRSRTDFSVQNGTEPLAHRPFVCGRGPAGLFAALLRARQGYRPIVLERGPALDERVKAVEHFSATSELDPNANIQFGEGGAGTFSDGKLTTRIGDALCGFVTEVFLQHGAPAEIAWKQKPHVGTGLLRGVLASPAELAIVTMADWLEKGSEARMNTPGNPAGNWQWRVAAKDLTPALARKIHEMSARYFRAEPLPEAEPKKEKAPAPQPKAKAADAKEEKTTAPAKKAAKSAK